MASTDTLRNPWGFNLISERDCRDYPETGWCAFGRSCWMRHVCVCEDEFVDCIVLSCYDVRLLDGTDEVIDVHWPAHYPIPNSGQRALCRRNIRRRRWEAKAVEANLPTDVTTRRSGSLCLDGIRILSAVEDGEADQPPSITLARGQYEPHEFYIPSEDMYIRDEIPMPVILEFRIPNKKRPLEMGLFAVVFPPSQDNLLFVNQADNEYAVRPDYQEATARPLKAWENLQKELEEVDSWLCLVVLFLGYILNSVSV